MIVPRQLTSHFEPPLAYGYLGEALTRIGVTSEIVDENLLSNSESAIDYVHDAAFLTAYYTTADRAAELARALRAIRPDVPIVLGGVHFSHCATPHVHDGVADLLVCGEGEHHMLDVCHGIESLLQGKASDRRIFGPSQDPNMTWKAMNPLTQIDLSPYRSICAEIGLTVSRGCPHGCKFCVATPHWGRKVQIADHRVVEEMTTDIAQAGFSTLSLWDESIWSAICSPEAQSVLEILSAHKSSFKWRCHLRVDEMSESNMKTLSGAGCTTVRVGVESLDGASQEAVGKVFSLGRLERALQTAREHGIAVWCSMIVGLPKDTFRSVTRSIGLMRSLMEKGLIDRVDCRPLTILPGSAFHTEFEMHGFRRIKEFPASPRDVSVLPPSLNLEEVETLLQEAEEAFLPLSRVDNMRI